MITTVKVHVNGRYRATVVQTLADGTRRDDVIVEGNYEGSPNPSGEATFWLPHPAHSIFEVSEQYLGEATPAPADPNALELGAAARQVGKDGY